jgi:hypothetical protein
MQRLHVSFVHGIFTDETVLKRTEQGTVVGRAWLCNSRQEPTFVRHSVEGARLLREHRL